MMVDTAILLAPAAVAAAAFALSMPRRQDGRFSKLMVRLRLPPRSYRWYAGIEVPDAGGIRIDYVVVSRFGVFVIRENRADGWIMGEVDQKSWKQRFPHTVSHFQNPLWQTRASLEALQTHLDVAPALLHPLVVFTGRCQFKTVMPANVVRGTGYAQYVRSFTRPVMSVREFERVAKQIEGISQARKRP